METINSPKTGKDDQKKDGNFNTNNTSVRKNTAEKYDAILKKDKFVVSTNSKVYRLEKHLGKGGYGEKLSWHFCISYCLLRIYALKRENILRTKIPKEIEVLERANECQCKQIRKYVDDMKAKKNQLKEQVYRAKLRIRLGNERKKFFRNSLPILDYIFMMIDGLGFEANPPYEQIQYMFEKEETKTMPPIQTTSADGATSTSAAMATYSRCQSVLVQDATVTPTESLSLLPNIHAE
uniref:Protein kinase domain-containing protein n=1 Tax=Elaeophora elaphi TaxID=1147741 RepID=A0A0R3RFN6_9BILA